MLCYYYSSKISAVVCIWVVFLFSKTLLLLFFKFYFIFKLYIIVLVLPNIKMNPSQVYMCSPSWTLLPSPSPYHPSGLSQCTSPKHPVSCNAFLVHYMCFGYGNYCMVLVFLVRLAVSPDYERSVGKYSIVFFSASCLKQLA